MAYPTAVNSQITDSISQVNTKVIGDSPAMAMGNLFVVTSQALGNAAHNAVSGQMQTGVTSLAAMTMGVSNLYCIDTAATGKAATEILGAK